MWSVTYCSHICNHIKFGELTSMAQWLIGCWSWYQGLYHISHRNWAHTCLHRPYNKPYIWYLQFRFLKWPEVLMFFTCCVIWGVIPLLQFTMMSRWDRDDSSRFIEPARMLIISYRQWFFFSSPSLGYLMFGLYPGFKFDGEVRQMTWFSAWWLIAGHSIHVNHVSPLVSPWITTNHHSSSLFTINHHYSPHSSPLIITIHQFRVWPPESTKAFEPSDPRRGQPREEWPQWPTANTVTWGAGDVFQDRNGGDKFFFFFLIYIYILFIYIYGFTTKI